MGREGARRLALVAGSVVVSALALVPFAPPPGETPDRVRTVDGPVWSGRWVPATAPPEEAPPATVVADAPASGVAAPAPAGPELPPPPEGAELATVVGVVPGDEGVGIPSPAPPEPSAASPTPGERVWAVVIGINDYPGRRSDLRVATADAHDLASALVQLGVPPDHVLPVYDRAATVDGVLEAVDWLVERAGPEDTAVLLYAGHIRDLGDGTEAVVTADGGWITDWYLANRLAGLRSRDAWFVIAGCYGGGFDELLGPGRVLTAAAGPGELAYESDGYGRSYLSEFVVRQGLIERAAGEPTVQAAVGYGMDRLAEQHPEHQLWHADMAGHLISLDGVRRDGSGAATPTPEDQPPAPPAADDLVAGTVCFLGLCGQRR